MRRNAFILFSSLAFVVFIYFPSVQSQIIAAKDLPYFMGKLRVSEGCEDSLDYSHFIQWRVDSRVASDNWAKLISPDESGFWAICLGNLESSMSKREAEAGILRFQLMGVVWDTDLLSGRLLTTWERVGRDSLKLVCIDSSISGCVKGEIKQVSYYPDSSILLYCRSFDWYHGIVSGSDQFFREESPCNFQPIYCVEWRNFRPTKTYVIADRLLLDRYRVSEVTEFLSYPKEYGMVIGGPSSLYDGSQLDSSKIRVIDLWDLAKEKFGIDTTAKEDKR